MLFDYEKLMRISSENLVLAFHYATAHDFALSYGTGSSYPVSSAPSGLPVADDEGSLVFVGEQTSLDVPPDKSSVDLQRYFLMACRSGSKIASCPSQVN